ncbi:MAG: hypothetical protein KJ607_14585 [Bacteroidetes bacterium]|nr:hypothetical protein [Bacteroidota bacterium]
MIKSKEDSSGTLHVNYRKGSTRYQGEMKDGKPVGTWSYFDEDSALIISSEYTGNFFHGYDEDTLITGQYSEGKPVGVWKYGHSECGRFIVEKQYNCENEMLYRYNILDETDQPVVLKAKIPAGRFFRNNGRAGKYASIDVRYGAKSLDISNFNDSIQGRFSNRFREANDFSGLGITFARNNAWHYSFSFNFLSRSNRIETDTFNLQLNGFNLLLNLGYDVISSDLFTVAPNVGLGFSELNLTLETEAPEETDEYNVWAPPVLTENRWNYYSSGLTADFSLDLRINIPFSKYDYMGMYIGGKGGYLVHGSNNGWIDNYRQTNNTGLPKASMSGLYWFITLGLMAFG